MHQAVAGASEERAVGAAGSPEEGAVGAAGPPEEGGGVGVCAELEALADTHFQDVLDESDELLHHRYWQWAGQIG